MYPVKILKIGTINNKKKVILNPGDHYVSDKTIIIQTLLGSCVSACLFDPVNHVMGMNHFLLSSPRNMEGSVYATDAGRYGVQAMEIVINGMMKLGAKKRYIEAKAFGGGNVLNIGKASKNYFAVGKVNCEFILEFLENEKIPLVSSDLGGELGRVIKFFGSDYSVYVRKIKQIDQSKLVKRDATYLNKTIKTQKEKTTDIELW